MRDLILKRIFPRGCGASRRTWRWTICATGGRTSSYRKTLPLSGSRILLCSSKRGSLCAKHLRNCPRGCALSRSSGWSKTSLTRRLRKLWASRRAWRERACSVQCACCEKNCNEWECTHEEVDERRHERSDERGGVRGHPRRVS